MFNIGNFLKRINDKRTQDVLLRQIIGDAIKEAFPSQFSGQTLVELDKISVKNSVVYIKNASNTLRSAILLKKVQILETINKKQGIIRIVDIK